LIAPVYFCSRNSANVAFWQARYASLNSAWPNQILPELDAQRQVAALESALFRSRAPALRQESARVLVRLLPQAAGLRGPLTALWACFAGLAEVPYRYPLLVALQREMLLLTAA